MRYVSACFAILIVAAIATTASARIWTDRKGREVEAEFVSYENGQVRIKRKSDGKEFVVPLSTFSDDDQSFLWVRRLASTYDARKEFDKWNARVASSSAQAMVAWKVALDKKTKEEIAAIDLLTFVGRYDPIWSADKYQAAESKRRVARIAHIPSEAIQKWKEELEKVHDDGVSELWTIAFVVDIDRLFAQDQWSDKESTLLLDRLKKLPIDAIESMGAAQNIGKGRAAVFLIQNDTSGDMSGRTAIRPIMGRLGLLGRFWNGIGLWLADLAT